MNNFMKWVHILFMGTPKERIQVMRAVVDAVKIFKKGKPSKQGQYFHELINSDKVEVIGFVPQITYIRVNSEDKSDLEVLWEHKFSVPTILYHLKDSPIMLVVNPNMDYNDSRLLEIEGNSELVEIRDLKGIIG